MDASPVENSSVDSRVTYFEEALKVVLEPLLFSHGYITTTRTRCAFEFESRSTVLRVLFHPYSFEISFDIATKANPQERFSLCDIVEAAGGEGGEFFQASSRERMFQCMESIVGFLKKYGEDALTGDANAFERMKMVSQIRSQRLTQQVVNQPIRASAEKAWKEKRFDEVKKQYELIRGGLTAVESKRLAYSIKQIQQENQSQLP